MQGIRTKGPRSLPSQRSFRVKEHPTVHTVHCRSWSICPIPARLRRPHPRTQTLRRKRQGLLPRSARCWQAHDWSSNGFQQGCLSGWWRLRQATPDPLRLQINQLPPSPSTQPLRPMPLHSQTILENKKMKMS